MEQTAWEHFGISSLNTPKAKKKLFLFCGRAKAQYIKISSITEITPQIQ
jgi:hypothetical protein